MDAPIQEAVEAVAVVETGITVQLQDLYRALQQGLITNEDYAAAKATLLNAFSSSGSSSTADLPPQTSASHVSRQTGGAGAAAQLVPVFCNSSPQNANYLSPGQPMPVPLSIGGQAEQQTNPPMAPPFPGSIDAIEQWYDYIFGARGGRRGRGGVLLCT